jgi:hypothetical protein
MRDGIEVTAERATFSAELLEATLAFGAGDSALAERRIADAEATRARVAKVIARRHASLHDVRTERLVSTRQRTAGRYDYGYLREADTQCFYERELIMVRNLVRGEDVPLPLCVL